MECLDCQISEIPEGQAGMVFLQCQDRKGYFHLCSPCWRKRRREAMQLEEERRRKLLEEENSASKKKKKKSGPKRGWNQFGSSH